MRDKNQEGIGQLVHRVLNDDMDARHTLLTSVEERLYPYLRRIVLNDDLAQDLLQDTHVDILKSLSRLDHPERFWPWAFRIATNKAFQHFRHQQVRRAKTDTMNEPEKCSDPKPQEGMQHLQSKELAEITRTALADINERYRMVLAMRFYEDMSHARIAEVLGCSEVGVRTTFFRAKRSLIKALKKRGVQRSALLSAVMSFGAATAITDLAQASVNIGATTTLSGSKLAIAACLILVPLIWLSQQDPGPQAAPQNAPISVHFVNQSLDMSAEEMDLNNLCSKVAREQWLTFPEGQAGPFQFRMQLWDPKQEKKFCWYIQNEDANYYVRFIHSELHIIYLRNKRVYDDNYMTQTLPTDSEEFCAFINEMEGADLTKRLNLIGVKHQRDAASGYVTQTRDTRFKDIGLFESDYNYAPLDESLFEAPTGYEVDDRRDAMHRRGWTQFTITGELNGHAITGTGQIPFVQATRKEHPEWIQIEHEGRLIAAQVDGQAVIYDVSQESHMVYEGGTLFKGLSRPWVGFHTMDAIRRDAAAERKRFETIVLEGGKPESGLDEKESDVVVNLTHVEGYHNYSIRYTIDAAVDVLKRIDVWKGSNNDIDQRVGVIEFSYIQDSEALNHVPASVPLDNGSDEASTHAPTVLWPLVLLDALEDEQPKSVADTALLRSVQIKDTHNEYESGNARH